MFLVAEVNSDDSDDDASCITYSTLDYDIRSATGKFAEVYVE